MINWNLSKFDRKSWMSHFMFKLVERPGHWKREHLIEFWLTLLKHPEEMIWSFHCSSDLVTEIVPVDWIMSGLDRRLWINNLVFGLVDGSGHWNGGHFDYILCKFGWSSGMSDLRLACSSAVKSLGFDEISSKIDWWSLMKDLTLALLERCDRDISARLTEFWVSLIERHEWLFWYS
jgi:hypothetical protein